MTEKLTLTGRMTSFLGHEINNPLAAITNVLYLAKQSLSDEIANCRLTRDGRRGTLCISPALLTNATLECRELG